MNLARISFLILSHGWPARAEAHRGHPEISPELHLRRKHLGLLQALEGRTLIYLDTNHWVNLRHVVLGSAQALPAYGKILRSINELALKKRLLCPVSFPLFLELMKQTDEATRLATARLMDCFSGGVCFQFPSDIERLELRQKMLQSVLREKSPDLSDQVWTKVGYVTGEMLPFNESFSKEDLCFLQKLSIDAMWATPLDQPVRARGHTREARYGDDSSRGKPAPVETGR